MSDAIYMLDASALLALMLGEDGAEVVHDILPCARVASVNLSEVVAKLQDRGVPEELILQSLAELDLEVVPCDRDHGVRAGLLRQATRSSGLSLGDRVCLAAAYIAGARAVTSDRLWVEVGKAIGVEVLYIRSVSASPQAS